MLLVTTVTGIIAKAIDSIIKLVEYAYTNRNYLMDSFLDLFLGRRNIITFETKIPESQQSYLGIDGYILKKMSKKVVASNAKMLRRYVKIDLIPSSKITYDSVTYSIGYKDAPTDQKNNRYTTKTFLMWSRKKSLDELKAMLDTFNKKYTKVITKNSIVIAKKEDLKHNVIYHDIFDVNFDKTLSSIYSLKAKNAVTHEIKKYRHDPIETRKMTMMLHGPPGTGKTTMITSIAKELDAILIMAKISDFENIDTLRSFIFQERYDVYNIAKNEYCVAFPENKVIVFEDVDADIGPIIKRRENVVESTTKSTDIATSIVAAIDSTKKEDITKKTKEINLSDLLNLLDGILRLKNITIIFTTNCIDNIDPAFYRPGRMTVCEFMGHLEHIEFMNYITDTYGPTKAKKIKGIHDLKFKISELTAATSATDSFEAFKKHLKI